MLGAGGRWCRGLRPLTPIPGSDDPSRAFWTEGPSERLRLELGGRKGEGRGLPRGSGSGLNSVRGLSLSWAWRPAHSRCLVRACRFRRFIYSWMRVWLCGPGVPQCVWLWSPRGCGLVRASVRAWWVVGGARSPGTAGLSSPFIPCSQSPWVRPEHSCGLSTSLLRAPRRPGPLLLLGPRVFPASAEWPWGCHQG